LKGLVLTDTFRLLEDRDSIPGTMLGDNSDRVRKQQDRDIRVIIGNPPYSSGQTSQNDNNQNQKYGVLDSRIADTYAAKSAAQNKNSLSGSYIRAIRWASDRVDNEGVICFVSNGGYIDGNTAVGLRQGLVDEFSAIYCFNLRGNARTAGEQRQKESGNVFDSGSRSTVAILLLVKDPRAVGPCRLLCKDIGGYLSQKQKLKIVAESDLDTIDWQEIIPNDEGDWVNQRDTRFAEVRSMRERRTNEGVIAAYSSGLKTNRDAWVYNDDESKRQSNVQRMIDFYNSQVEAFQEHCKSVDLTNPTTRDVDSFIDYDPTKISWNRADKTSVKNWKYYTFEENSLTLSTYRPFNKQKVYFNRRLNDMVYLLPSMFPSPEEKNFGFYLTGTGTDEPFSTCMVDQIPDLAFWGSSNGQFFSRYTYRETGSGDDLFSSS